MSIEVPGDNIRCDYDDVPGVPYEYRGQAFSGLIAYRGDRICRGCAARRMETEGTDILVVDDRPTVPDHVYNTVRDADLVQIWVPPERRGIDGRDIRHRSVRR